MDLKDIQNLIKFVAKSGANEVKLEMEDVKITIKAFTECRAKLEAGEYKSDTFQDISALRV